MRHDVHYDPQAESIRARYDWKTQQRWQHVAASGLDRPQPLVDDSLEQFIAEHYWGYSQQRDGSTFEYRVQHPSWRIWQATQVEFDCDVENLYGKEFQTILSRPPDSAFIADGSNVTVSFPRRIK